VRVVTISPGTVTGHASAGGAIPADVEFLNREAGAFLNTVTDNGKKLKLNRRVERADAAPVGVASGRLSGAQILRQPFSTRRVRMKRREFLVMLAAGAAVL
jgi:hypothetical protein